MSAISDFSTALLVGFVVSCFWFSAISLFVNEYYKYYDYIARTSPIDFDLDQRTTRMFYGLYVGGFVIAVLVRLI